MKNRERHPKKVLVARLSAIGDVVMASPLIGALKRTWPEARIFWFVEELSAPLLAHNPDIEETIVWPRRRWRHMLREGRLLSLFQAVFAFIRDLRRRKFDLALDAQGLFKSGIWVFLSGAAERVGIGSREGSRFFMTKVVDRSAAGVGISSQYLLLAKELGLDVGKFRMELAIDPEADRFAEGFIEDLGSGCAVLCPFTTRPQKEWIEKRWRETAQWITDNTELSVVVFGGEEDRKAARALQIGLGSRVRSMAGQTSLMQAAALMKRASLLIGVDTGLTHMAIALDTPTIALFGATNPYLDTTGTSGTVPPFWG
jgi:heptosyltransferase-1